jgi:hypothetical protein
MGGGRVSGRGPGRPPLEGGAVQYNVRLPAPLRERLRAVAEARGEPEADVVREYIERGVKRDERRLGDGHLER